MLPHFVSLARQECSLQYATTLHTTVYQSAPQPPIAELSAHASADTKYSHTCLGVFTKYLAFGWTSVRGWAIPNLIMTVPECWLLVFVHSVIHGNNNCLVRTRGERLPLSPTFNPWYPSNHNLNSPNALTYVLPPRPPLVSLLRLIGSRIHTRRHWEITMPCHVQAGEHRGADKALFAQLTPPRPGSRIKENYHSPDPATSKTGPWLAR